MFPTLTREQVSRIAAHGRRRATARGDVLVDLGDKTVPIFVVALARPAFLLETSRPRIFAVGDVRGGNVKRVASAVGEGSIAVAFVHQVLRQ